MRREVTPFRLQVRPSRLWLGFVTCMHGAFIAVALAYLPGYWWMLLPLPATLFYCLRADGWLAARPGPDDLAVGPRGELSIMLNGKPCAARLRPESTVWSWLTVLRLESEGRSLNLMVLPDSALAEPRRRLNMYVRWFRTTHSQNPTVQDS